MALVYNYQNLLVTIEKLLLLLFVSFFGLWPHTITANIVVGLDEYLLNSVQDIQLTLCPMLLL